jgi:GxxExxY protein
VRSTTELDHKEHKEHQGLAPSLEAVGRHVVDAAIKVHTALGPGLLESAYEHCLAFELRDRGLKAERQVPLPIIYRGMKLDAGYRLDLLVEGSVIVEIKAADSMPRLFEAQVLTYLKLSGCRLGYLVNFNTGQVRDGLRRLVL